MQGKIYIVLGVLLSFSITSFPLILLFLNIKATRRSNLFHGLDPLISEMSDTREEEGFPFS